MSNRDPETIERMRSMVVRRLQTAGEQGMNVSELASMLRAEFDGTLDYCRNVLINLALSGKIYRKMCAQPQGGIGGRYFLQPDWAEAYTQSRIKPKKDDQVYIHPKQTIPKFGIEAEREVAMHDFGPGITIKPGVKVQVLTRYEGDYRIKVDPATIQRQVDSSQCRDWAKA